MCEQGTLPLVESIAHCSGAGDESQDRACPLRKRYGVRALTSVMSVLRDGTAPAGCRFSFHSPSRTTRHATCSLTVSGIAPVQS